MTASFLIAFNSIIPIILGALVGFLFGRHFRPDPQSIARISLYVMLPCLIFVSISEAEINASDLGSITVLVFLISLVLLLIGWLLARRFGMANATQGGFVLAVLLMNTGNFGLPFIQFALGDAALQIAALIFVLSAVVTNTLGIYVASAGTVTVRQGVRNIVNNPLAYATTAGLLVNITGVTLPTFLTRSVTLFGQGSVPLLLLLLGIQISRISLRDAAGWSLSSLGWVMVVRLLLTPVLVLAVSAIFGVSDFIRNVALLQLSTPTAVTAVVLASEYGSDAEFVSSAILTTTIASIFTLSLILIGIIQP